MAQWTRQTQWRQGSLLPAKSAIALKLVQEAESEHFVFIATSHDCDIANANLRIEPTVEFIRGEVVDKIDGSFTRAKNARILHLEFDTPTGKIAVEFNIRERFDVGKEALADYLPEDNWSHCSRMGLGSLRWWLAARYFRSSFPDSFEKHLVQTKLDERIDKLLSPLGDAVYGIFFLVDDGSGNNRSDDDTYELRAFVVYDSESDEKQIVAIQKAAKDIDAAFRAKLQDSRSRHWGKIEMVSCGAVSDESFSYANSRIFKQWRLEHRSLDDESQELPVPSV